MLDIIKLVTLKALTIGLFIAAAANSSQAFGAGLDFLPTTKKTSVVVKRLNKAELVALAKGTNPVCIKIMGRVQYVNPSWTKLRLKKSACSKKGKVKQDYERALGITVIYVDQSNLTTDLLKSVLRK